MKIEILYVPGCPNYPAAVERVREALAAEGVGEQIQRVAITTANEASAWRFPGSPTVRINGDDVEPVREGPAGSLACRIYANQSGLPSEELLRTAILQAKRRE